MRLTALAHKIEVEVGQGCTALVKRLACCFRFPKCPRRRDGRVAEGARLESVFTRKGNVGSNPTLSAMYC